MKKTNFLSLLNFKLKVALPLLGLSTLINGLWSASLLMIINNKIAGVPLPFFSNYDWLVYVVLMITSLILTFYFKAYMIKVTLNFGTEMVLEIMNKLRLSNYESYLKLGEARVRTAMQDIGTLEDIPGSIVAFFNALVMILAVIVYMFWLYPEGAVLILILVAILSFVYSYRNKIIEKSMDTERDLDEAFMYNYNDFLHGFNKIKMSSKRSDSIFYDHLSKNRNNAIKHSIKSEIAAFGNDLVGQYSFYLIIGIILFILPLFMGIDQTSLSGFMITILFLMGPLTTFINLMKSIIGYKIAFERLNEFNKITTGNLKSSEAIEVSDKLPVFQNLLIDDLTYEYLSEEGSVIFKLKPIKLRIDKGEVVFISGGNGSGKSTFVNLLSGLYVPTSGQILYNNFLISDVNRSNYRDQISCIFSDNYLFSENYDNFDLLPSNNHLNKLLKKMSLDDIIRQDITNNKIFNNLSSGQKKRLALIYSLLEDKNIFIFDEWAAEQDPEFRKYFYNSIIPDLKSKGKTIIAITHDDAYYEFCDRLIKFQDGKIVSVLNKNSISI